MPVAQIHAGGGRYFATTSETLEPARNRVPGLALWEITVPRLLPFLCVRLTAPVAQCLALSVRLASASRLPLRDGTVQPPPCDLVPEDPFGTFTRDVADASTASPTTWPVT
jgi:hypothetical protein